MDKEKKKAKHKNQATSGGNEVSRKVSGNSRSATGTHSSKCNLQPGHSLMDWIRLSSSGRDLTGMGQAAGTLTVTPKELAKHDKPNDAWMALRGRVFNVTAYLDFHPGGLDEIMQGVGKDATMFFDSVHPWVNYESMLAKCYVGRLVAADPKMISDPVFKSLEIPTSKVINSIKANALQSPNSSTIKVKSFRKEEEGDDVSVSSESLQNVPRFDWIQKIDHIHLIFYTKPFCNPHIDVIPPDKNKVISISFVYEQYLFSNEIKFLKSVEWPCRIRVVGETGKVEIHFAKTVSGVWENYGVLKQTSQTVSKTSGLRFKCRLINKVRVTHNSFLMEWERMDGAKIVVPVGKHVGVFGVIEGEGDHLLGEEIARSYTPVPKSLFAKYSCQQFVSDSICLMVKRYPEGNISRYLCDKNKGDFVEFSNPLGTFNLEDLDNRETFLLVAAGTGITPMLGLILFLLERRIRKCQCITLLFFNKKEEDILFGSQLEMIQKENNKIKVLHVLSDPTSTWVGLKGHVTRDILEDAIRRHIADTGYVKSDVYVTICGPVTFTEQTERLFHDLDFKKEQIYLFMG